MIKHLTSQIAISLENARLHENLKRTEAEYRGIFENATEGIYRSSQDGHFLSANPAMARIFGYSSPEELILSLTDDFFGSVRNLGILGALEKRETDVILGNPRSSRLRVNYQLPAGVKVKSTPDARDIDSRFGRFQLAVDSSRKDALQLDRLYVLKKNRVPLAQYNEFRQLSANVDQLSNEKIVLKK